MKKVLFLMAVFLLCACGSEVEYFENAAHDEKENAGVNQGHDYPDSDQINNSK